MNQQLNLITLGVRDLERARRFYRDGLGWRESSASQESVAFFNAGGLVLALWSRAELAADVPVVDDGHGFNGIALGQILASRESVDAAIADARSAGAAILKEPADTFWGGYSGYFADPEDYVWELAWNPFFPRDEQGIVLAPE